MGYNKFISKFYVCQFSHVIPNWHFLNFICIFLKVIVIYITRKVSKIYKYKALPKLCNRILNLQKILISWLTVPYLFFSLFFHIFFSYSFTNLFYNSCNPLPYEELKFSPFPLQFVVYLFFINQFFLVLFFPCFTPVTFFYKVNGLVKSIYKYSLYRKTQKTLVELMGNERSLFH